MPAYDVISGYKVNMQKKVALPLNLCAEQLSLSKFPFQWETHKIQNLGLKISNQLDNIFSLSFEPFFKRA